MGRKSNKQEEILAFLNDFMEKYEYAPSVRQICDGVGLKSTATVHYHLRAMKDLGLITMDAGHNRTIVLTGREEEEQQGIPIVGTVAAGIPITAVEHLDGYLPWHGQEGDFALRVKGDSMIDAAIAPGDYVIVRKQSTANHGEIVVAMLDEEATVKRLSLTDGVWLLPENENYNPIDGRDAIILGVVKGLHRLYQ